MEDTLGDVGEFGLIARLVAAIPSAPRVILGAGADDAAIVVSPTEGPLLATADMLVEGTHFDLAFSSHEDVGAKSMAVNLSDIAAMGGMPRYALICLGAPARTSIGAIESLYAGMRAAANAADVSLVGGDTVKTDRLTIAITLIGEAGAVVPVRRSGARPGDVLCVTGALGAAAAGLAAFQAGTEGRRLLDRWPDLARAHRTPVARVREGRAAAIAGARAMIDISDGLLADVSHVCEASGVGVRIDLDAIPEHPGVGEATKVGLANGTEVSPLWNRGDDYELAMAVPPEMVDGVRAAVAPTPLTVIGVFTTGSAVDVPGMPPGSHGALVRGGWDHFG